METKFNFNSQVCSSLEQSRRLLALGLKKETADMVYHSFGYIIDEWGNKERRFKQPTMVVEGWESKYDIPAWSLHRMIEILDTNPCVFYTNCGYDNIIDRIEDYIKEGLIDTRYLEEWCLNEEEK